MPAGELAGRLLEELRPGAIELGCASQLERVATIVADGTGSVRQLAIAEQSGGDLVDLVRRAVVIGS